MPFKCCMGNNLQDNSNEEHKDSNYIKKIPKPIDLNEGYNSQLELLIFNNRQNNNRIDRGYHFINKATNKSKYDSAKYFSINPITFVETKVSNVVNTPGGPAIAEASSNIVFSGCNSPINLVTSIEATPNAKNSSYIEPFLPTTNKINQTDSNYSIAEKKKLEDKNFVEKSSEINNYSEICKASDQKKGHINVEEIKFPLITKSDRAQKEFGLENTYPEEMNYSTKNEDEYECENGQIQKCIVNTGNLSDEYKYDNDTIKKNDKNEEITDIGIPDIKNDIDELILLSNKSKNKDNHLEKKKKKFKKTIHIEISFSPKNNIFVDAQHNQNKIKTQLEPHNKIKLGLNDHNGQGPTQSKFFFGSNNKKSTSIDSNDSNSNRFDESPFEDNQKVGNDEPINKTKSCETYESEFKQMSEEPVHIMNNNSTKEEISNIRENCVSSNLPLSDIIANTQNQAVIDYNSSFEKHSSLDIKSFEKLIPFIDESETKINHLTNIEKNEKSKCFAKEKSFDSLTEIKQPKNKVIEFSRETLEKLNGSLPIVESDPQMAQLFASAQIRIEDINNQNKSFEDINSPEECDPIDSIVKFLDNPSKYKDSISWATIKAIKEVYEPQVEYAKKELERWMNSENKSDESEENIEYYNNLISELQEKVVLAEKARELLLTQYKNDDIQFMIQNEKISLEEIKKKISKESNELKFLEERYLNGSLNLKEEVRTSRIKIQNLENELKSKLAEIHKLDELLKIHEDC
ncbi:uncharacterized protein cubi_01838 [Cryptosporidium ubiquitum]|uniref:Uncharacterized protein n=1 Tax=Cryptosporidium ubiquitum TaxID=857276 RepID=A0A1J4MR00_9CRYT|nr:uncharacterized protein cubi_01838 [Cryptosporidium ubiquitum]OII75317.1 hypothetical protein cubi_01838 [Cryptosporidium ubiquitum]